jgi:periplasmic protein TonB
MAYGDLSLGFGGRALSVAAILAFHAAAGGAFVKGMDVIVFLPVREGAITGITLPPPAPLRRLTPNPTSRGVPDEMIVQEPDAGSAPVEPATFLWDAPGPGQPEAAAPAWQYPTSRRGTGCEDCAWVGSGLEPWVYRDNVDPYLIEMGPTTDLTMTAPVPATPATPANDPATWFQPGDYPLIRSEVEGAVAYTLIVGTDGRVTNCAVLQSSASAALDRATCAAIRVRARFHPATSWEGTPVVGTYNGTARWELPN